MLYSVDDFNPILHFEMRSLPLYWGNLKKILSPKNVLSENDLTYLKDLGLHLKRLGFDDFESLVFPQVPVTNITQLDNNMFTINIGGVTLGENRYVATFDFDLEILKQITGKIPSAGMEKLLVRNNASRTSVKFANIAYLINLDCEVGKNLEENDKEIFLPLKINQILN